MGGWLCHLMIVIKRNRCLERHDFGIHGRPTY